MSSVLIVYDEDALRELLAKAIERKGMQALKAKDGLEAIALCEKYQPQCILLDIKLPDIDGIEVFRKIKEMNAEAKVYFISGSDNEDFKQTAKSLGANGYLVKPIVINDVMKIIEDLGKTTL